MKKRKWIYIQHPTVYEIFCDICNGTNIDWSEYEHMIWCYDCQKDTRGTGGIFNGRIGIHVCELLGMHFHRYHIEKNEIQKFNPETNQYVPFCCPLERCITSEGISEG